MRRTEVNESGVVGVVCEPDQPTGSFAVVLSGSGGGIPDGYASRLAEHGITSFALGYFGAPGLPPALVEIPLESLARGIDLFRERFAAGAAVGVMGSSKGAELVLLLSSYLGESIGPIVAVAPTCVAWYGLGHVGDDDSADRPSWTWQGRPVPFLPYSDGAVPIFSDRGIRVDVCYDLSRYAASDIDAARIPVEKGRGPFLLLSADDDHMWAASPMAAEVVNRMREHGRPDDIVHVSYAGAGHVFLHRAFLPAPDPSTAPRYDFGGTDEADDTAAADAWPRIVEFLRAGAS